MSTQPESFPWPAPGGCALIDRTGVAGQRKLSGCVDKPPGRPHFRLWDAVCSTQRHVHAARRKDLDCGALCIQACSGYCATVNNKPTWKAPCQTLEWSMQHAKARARSPSQESLTAVRHAHTACSGFCAAVNDEPTSPDHSNTRSLTLDHLLRAHASSLAYLSCAGNLADMRVSHIRQVCTNLSLTFGVLKGSREST